MLLVCSLPVLQVDGRDHWCSSCGFALLFCPLYRGKVHSWETSSGVCIFGEFGVWRDKGFGVANFLHVCNLKLFLLMMQMMNWVCCLLHTLSATIIPNCTRISSKRKQSCRKRKTSSQMWTLTWIWTMLLPWVVLLPKFGLIVWFLYTTTLMAPTNPHSSICNLKWHPLSLIYLRRMATTTALLLWATV